MIIIKKIFSALLAMPIALTCFSTGSSVAGNIESPASARLFTDVEMNELIPLIEAADNYMISIDNSCDNSLANLSLAMSTGSDYGYQDLDKRSNFAGRKQLYNDLMHCMETVWDSEKDSMKMTNILIGDFYVMEILVLEDYGLTFDEASEVYETFRNDNPVFYYASNAFMGFPVTTDMTYLMIACYSDFAEASVKQKYNAMIQPYIESYSSCVKGESVYDDSKAIHDRLILSMDYAYAEDGVTSSETGIAHSIIGAIEGEGTCETYAKTYQLLCNYYDIDNVFVTGTVNNGHTWNIVKLDDGKYYNVDCTGDDLGDTAGYEYFAVGTQKLYKTHTLNTPENTGADFLYDLPEISIYDYIPEITTTTTTTSTTTTTTTTQTTTVPKPPVTVKGDINDDGAFDSADIVILQKWLLTANDASFINWKNADLYEDGKIDVFDLVLMKKSLINQYVMP